MTESYFLENSHRLLWVDTDNRQIISMKSRGFPQTPQDIMEKYNWCSVPQYTAYPVIGHLIRGVFSVHPSLGSRVRTIPIKAPRGATIIDRMSTGVEMYIGFSAATIRSHVQRPTNKSKASKCNHPMRITSLSSNISTTISGVGIWVPRRMKMSTTLGRTAKA